MSKTKYFFYFFHFRVFLFAVLKLTIKFFSLDSGFSNKYFPIVKKPFILNCTAAEDTPMLPVRWLRNGQPFLPDGQRVFPRSSSLVFSSILPDDSGHYTCIVGDNQKAENVIVDVIFHGKPKSDFLKISTFKHLCLNVKKKDNNKMSTISKIHIANNKFTAEQQRPLKQIGGIRYLGVSIPCQPVAPAIVKIVKNERNRN